MTQGLTLNGVLSGVKGLRKAGLGTLVLGNPANTVSGTLNITNTAPDQTVVMTSGTGISVTGTYPNFTVTNDVHIPAKASPGWNLYLPIPFSKGCRIVLRADSPKSGGGMIDWQQYSNGVRLTPLRFHAQRNIAQPGKPTEPFPIAETEGTGFLAGYVMGWRQRDHSDMVFHNGGTRLLMDFFQHEMLISTFLKRFQFHFQLLEKRCALLVGNVV
jgi:autotransporter-associated beta strand protein